MRNPRPVRTGALTILVFLLVQPGVAGLCFAGLHAVSGAMADPGGNAFNPLWAFFAGALAHLPAAGFTGFLMALASHRIRRAGWWLTTGALLGWLLATLVVLLLVRSAFAQGISVILFAAAMAGLPAAPGGALAAAATLRLRSRPWLRPVAEAFD